MAAVPGAPVVFLCASCGGCPSRALHLAGSGWMAYSCGGRFLWGWWWLGAPLGFLPGASTASPSTASPLWVLAPPPSAAYPSRVRRTFRLQLAGLLLRWCLVVGLVGCWLRHLVFSRVPCSSSGACSLRSFPSCWFPWGFRVTGCLSFCFPGDVGWESALPFFFCASLAPTD